MFSRKLTALRYKEKDYFIASNQDHLRKLTIWLETEKINHYGGKDAEALTTTPLPQWMEIFSKYLADLGCPFSVNETTQSVDWLLGRALNKQYAANAEKFSKNSASNVEIRSQRPDTDVFLDLYENTSAFEKGVAELATLLDIKQHPTDAMVTFRAIAMLAERLQAGEKSPRATTKFDVESLPTGPTLGDKTLDTARRIFQLLFLDDMRTLHTQVNEALSAVQRITADPKTDNALGVVGK